MLSGKIEISNPRRHSTQSMGWRLFTVDDVYYTYSIQNGIIAGKARSAYLDHARNGDALPDFGKEEWIVNSPAYSFVTKNSTDRVSVLTGIGVKISSFTFLDEPILMLYPFSWVGPRGSITISNVGAGPVVDPVYTIRLFDRRQCSPSVQLARAMEEKYGEGWFGDDGAKLEIAQILHSQLKSEPLYSGTITRGTFDGHDDFGVFSSEPSAGSYCLELTVEYGTPNKRKQARFFVEIKPPPEEGNGVAAEHIYDFEVLADEKEEQFYTLNPPRRLKPQDVDNFGVRLRFTKNGTYEFTIYSHLSDGTVTSKEAHVLDFWAPIERHEVAPEESPIESKPPAPL